MAYNTSNKVHFGRLKRATDKLRVHKVSVSELKPFLNKSEQTICQTTHGFNDNLLYRSAQISMPTKLQTPQYKHNARAVTPR